MKNLYYWLNTIILLGLFLTTSCQMDEAENLSRASTELMPDEYFVSAQDAIEVASLLNAEGVIEESDVKTALAARISKPTKTIKESKTLNDAKSRDAFHIINYEGGGFSIISGDKRLPAVLAYNAEGYIDLDTYGENLGLYIWLNDLKNTITSLRDNIDSTESELAIGWEPEIGITKEDPCDPCGPAPYPHFTYGPLMQKSWGQGCGFNDFSPAKNGPCNRAPAGCGPVAVAQVLWKHRNRLGQVTYNGIPINFNNMPNSLSLFQPGEAPDLARLLRFIGDWIIIDWAADYAMALPSKIPDLFILLGFTSQMRDVNEGVVTANIKNGNPVIFKARTPGFLGISFNHHIWVCEGYRSLNYGQYYMNWGWNGHANGWYYTQTWKPNGTDNDYSKDRKMITVN